jgi:hypothetical protein
MAVTQTDIDNLNAALASGEKIVRIGDKYIEYRSPEAIIAARNDLQKQLNAQRSSPRGKIFYVTQTGRGYR